MSERDELAAIIDNRWHGYGYNPQGAADAILAAGYRKAAEVIPDEAVEAALKALFPNPERDYTRDIAWAQSIKVILEAAAPHMLAEAWDEGEQAGALNHAAEEYPDVKDTPNPYRSQV